MTLTRELQPKCKTNNHRRFLYLWIQRYSTKKEINVWGKKDKFKISKVVYDLNMKKTIVTRYHLGKSILNLCKETWPNKDPYLRSSIIRG